MGLSIVPICCTQTHLPAEELQLYASLQIISSQFKHMKTILRDNNPQHVNWQPPSEQASS